MQEQTLCIEKLTHVFSHCIAYMTWLLLTFALKNITWDIVCVFDCIQEIAYSFVHWRRNTSNICCIAFTFTVAKRILLCIEEIKYVPLHLHTRANIPFCTEEITCVLLETFSSLKQRPGDVGISFKQKLLFIEKRAVGRCSHPSPTNA